MPRSRVLLFLAVAFASVVPAMGEETPASRGPSKPRFFLYPSVSDFTFRQYGTGGGSPVKETVTLYGIGVEAVFPLKDSLEVTLRADASFGPGTYDGFARSVLDPSAMVRVETDSFWMQFDLEGDIGRRYPVGERAVLTPFFGMMLRGWSRDVDGTTATDTDGSRYPVRGAEEYWQTGFARIGVKGEYQVRPDFALEVEGGASLPLFVAVKAGELPYYANDTEPFPGGGPYPFARVSVAYRWLRIEWFYEKEGFRASHLPNDASILGSTEPTLPESEATSTGIRVGVLF